MGLFKGINKNSIIGATINVLESIQQGETFAEKMILTFRREAMKDQDIDFVIRTFKNKFGIQAFDMYMEPVVDEGTLTIDNWNFVVNEKVLFTSEGLDSLVTKVSESIMTQDSIFTDEVVRRLKVCLA